jgi:transposase
MRATTVVIQPAYTLGGSIMQVTTLGIDLAKNVVQVHGVDAKRHVVLRKRFSRAKVLPFLAQLPPYLIGIEASGGAHHGARELSKLGHTVKLMSPQFVRPYVKNQKNDANDAEGICEAVSRPHMRFVPMKSVDQQDMQALHCIRERQIKARTALVNQMRGLLAEYGIVIAQGVSKVRHALPALLEDADHALTWNGREWLSALAWALRLLEQHITETEQKMQRVFERDEACQRLAQLEGIGPLTATALVAAVGTATTFQNGRQMAAWLGLVPRRHASGGKPTLLGISKRGDGYLCKLLIHGARAVIRQVDKKKDPRSRWLQGVRECRGTNRACVAQANKTARIA